MDKIITIETTQVIDGTTYIVRSQLPNSEYVKSLKNKIKKLILNNLKNT